MLAQFAVLVLAASLFDAAAAAAVTGAAVAARRLWPWAAPVTRDLVHRWNEPSVPGAQWLMPGVRISYTRIAFFWPGQG